MNQFLASPIQQSPSVALLCGIAFCTVGYAMACMHAYSRAPSLVALAATICIVLVFLEGFWNRISVTPVERLAVVMPVAVNIGLTWALYRRRSSRQSFAVLTADAAV